MQVADIFRQAALKTLFLNELYQNFCQPLSLYKFLYNDRGCAGQHRVALIRLQTNPFAVGAR